MRVEMFTFLVAGLICLGGALGVVLLRNTVHSALSLVATLFGVAVLFLNQGAYFLAAVQVIVYAGAIVILFLFVIMLLGADSADDLGTDPIVGQRLSAIVVGVLVLGLSLVALLAGPEVVTGAASSVAPLSSDIPNVNQLGRVLFTDYVFAFEITAVLLTIAVVGAVVLSRRSRSRAIDLDEFPDGTALDELARAGEDFGGGSEAIADPADEADGGAPSDVAAPSIGHTAAEGNTEADSEEVAP